ncbi:hypothetical protein M5K25_019277 [Dendrobium thyrsiflorum]|uniref:DUF4283 domain-containing protein n=1 Tax=Dendrobium thyrsiflorum TaxID=117978 RepID=A0ABD0UEI0_DENTH
MVFLDPSLFDASFPPLSTHSKPSSSTKPPSPLNWNKILIGSPSPCDFQISSFPTPEDTIPFPHEDIVDASDEWNLALVGYSLGRRLYYETLLGAIRKHWKLKGMLKLTSLSDGFFLFKFSSSEDYEQIWSKGAWFLLGKPFVFQKWTPHFSPNREEFTSVPIWFKIHDLPLCCWTPVGISKIATKIVEPLTVDALTASKSRLTYARVCVLVDSSAKYPETVPISVEGKIFNLKIEYEWRPTVCSFCMSLNHSPSVCPSNPNLEILPPVAPSRGRSISRRNRPLSKNPKGQINLSIPNLYSPNDESSSSDTQSLNIAGPSSKIVSPNKFSSLQEDPELDVSSTQDPKPSSKTSTFISKSIPNWVGNPSLAAQSSLKTDQPTSPGHRKTMHKGFNTSDKILSAKNLAAREKLDMLCLLENRILPENLSDPWFCSSHRVFNNEESFHNFDQASHGRIWIKWDPEKSSFSPLHSSKQYVTGITSAHGSQPCLLSVIYASNSFSDRFSLWDDLRSQDPRDSMPWIIIGDFNCCRFQSEKSGGNAIPASKLAPFNDFIFYSNVTEIPSTGIFLTWYNQRTVNPILIRLDRMLANDAWFRAFPNSSYKALNSHISDRSPLILNSGHDLKFLPRFMYKNFWSNFSEFWSLLVAVFDEPYTGNPISWFYKRLKQLKSLTKRKDWASSNLIMAKCKNLEGQQLNCQMALDNDPHNGELSNRLKQINGELNFYYSSWSSWIVQRSKVKWLSKGEDDLKFLFSKVRKRSSSNANALKASILGPGSSYQDNISGIINHFYELFNSPNPSNYDKDSLPPGNVIHESQKPGLISPITNDEIKATIFSGCSDSAPGPDGFNFAFYKNTWSITGRHANSQNCNNLMKIFQFFSRQSGLYLNLNKSTLLAPQNITIYNDIANCLQIPIIASKFTYLGIPISLARIKLSDFSPLLDSITNRLSGWKAKLLSFAGRVQFIKFTITNIVAYWMRGALIPKSIIKAIGKICAKFLFFGGDHSKRLHLISWQNTYKPYAKGGLCITSLKAIRHALNCAVICRFYNHHTPFSAWLRTRYSSPWKPPDPMDFAFWKEICRTATCVRGNFKFIINDNSPASILWDHWCMGANLSNLFPDLCRNSAALLKWESVKDWSHNTSWIFPNHIDSAIANELNSLLSSIPISTNVSTHVAWKDNIKCNYKDFYKDYFERDETVAWHKLVWHKNKALRFSVFTWQALMGGLKTVDTLIRRNIHISDPNCTLCLDDDDTCPPFPWTVHGQPGKDALTLDDPSRLFFLSPGLTATYLLNHNAAPTYQLLGTKFDPFGFLACSNLFSFFYPLQVPFVFSCNQFC